MKYTLVLLKMYIKSLTFSGLQLQYQYRNCMVGLVQSKSPFQRWQLVCFHGNTVVLTIFNNLVYSPNTHTIWKRFLEKYKSYRTLIKTTHFLGVFCEAGVVQQCPDAQVRMIQDGLNPFVVLFLEKLTPGILRTTHPE